jgi:hypothetical protein
MVVSVMLEAMMRTLRGGVADTTQVASVFVDTGTEFSDHTDVASASKQCTLTLNSYGLPQMRLFAVHETSAE